MPLRVSRNTDCDFVLDLLLLTNGQYHYYVLITNLVRLLCFMRKVKARPEYEWCRNCFNLTKNHGALVNHLRSCNSHDVATIVKPTEEKKKLVFSNYQARWFVPLVIYFDFESILKPVSTCSNSLTRSGTDTIELHNPPGLAFCVVEHGNPKPIVFKVERSQTCIQKFIKTIHQLANDIYGRKRQHRTFEGTVEEISDECWLCFSHRMKLFWIFVTTVEKFWGGRLANVT